MADIELDFDGALDEVMLDQRPKQDHGQVMELNSHILCLN